MEANPLDLSLLQKMTIGEKFNKQEPPVLLSRLPDEQEKD